MKTQTSDGRNASWTRREALGLGFGVLSSAVLAPGGPRAQEAAQAAAPVAAGPKVEVGVIGLGGRGNLVAGKIAEHGGYRIAAVADYFPDVAREAGTRFGVPEARVFSGLQGYRRLLESKVDAVFLETPPYCFPEHAAAAVAAGCHVYMAKPVACDVPGTLSIRDSARAAQAKKKVFFVDFQMRVDPFIRECVKRVHAGGLEGISLVRSFYDDEGFPDPELTATVESRLRNLTWCNDDALGAGYFVNAGIHAIDAALWVAGASPVSAVGVSDRRRNNPHGDAHDVFSLTFKLANGLLLNHSGEHIANLGGFRCGVDVLGHGAFTELRYGGKSWLRGGPTPYRGGETPGLYGDAIGLNVAEFHRCVTAGDATNPTVESSVASTLATILGREACRRGSELTMEQLLKENKRIEADLKGLKS